MKTNILDFLDAGALTHSPGATFVKDGELCWTFSEFGERVDRIGSALLQLEIGIGDAVAVFIHNGAPVLAADFGILRTGAAFMNIDVGLPATRLGALFANVKPRAIIVTEATRDSLPADLAAQVVVYDDLLTADIDPAALAQRRPEIIDTDAACLIATSGSTGTPKAVALSHRGLIDFGDWFDQRFDVSADDVVGSLSPLFFDGFIPGLFMSLLHGAQFVILPKESAAFPIKLAGELEKHGVTFIFWVPSTLVPLAKLRILDKIALPRLRFVGFAGEVMPPSALSYLRQALPDATFVNFYGPIEISVICSYFVVPKDFPHDYPIPIGVACGNTRIVILDDNERRCELGQPGELCVSGSSVALGYWNDPATTSQAFVRNPLVTTHAETIYRTGDVASFDDGGVITFIGRKDFQIKHQGYRIDLGEIEYAADVALGFDAVSVIYDRETRNIVLFYEAAAEWAALEVRTRLAVRLPKYMLPHKIVRLDAMPLNANGKIDRKQLESTLRTSAATG